jgi:hypothetical protein
MPINPYGAVPNALRETRLSLRDIMQDYMANKVAESNLQIAKAKADVERGSIEANLEQARMTDLREVARIAQAGQQFEKNYGLHERETSLRERIEPERIGLERDRVNILKSEDARKAREEGRMSQVRTIGEWADLAGINRGILDMYGINPGVKISRRDAELSLKNFADLVRQHPSLGLMAHGFSLKSDLLDLQTKLADPGLTAEEKTALRATYDKKFPQFENLDDFIMKEKMPDQAKIADTARKTYAENPQLQNKYPNFESYLEAFATDLQHTRSIFQNDIKALKKKHLEMTEGITPEVVRDYARKIESLDIPQADKHRIAIQAKAFVDKGDLGAAGRFLKKMYDAGAKWSIPGTKVTEDLWPAEATGVTGQP